MKLPKRVDTHVLRSRVQSTLASRNIYCNETQVIYMIFTHGILLFNEQVS